MSTRTAMEEKPEAGRENFFRLLARLSPDRERAWEEYAGLRQKLVAYFEPHLEAEELAENVLDRIARKEDSFGIRNIVEFAFGVARNLKKEIYRRDMVKAQAPVSDDFPADVATPEHTLIESLEAARKRKCFLLCMQQLTAEERELIFEYFPNDDAEPDERRMKLAQRLNRSSGALRTRMTRLRERLESCCERCIRGKNGTRMRAGADR